MMGSGSYGYSSGDSQDYAQVYAVCPDMLEQDRKDPDIYDSVHGYFRNPTVFEISADFANGGAFRHMTRSGNNVRIDGTVMYVLTITGKLLAGFRLNPNDANKHAPHPTLIGGLNPRVQCAGIMSFRAGKIQWINANSGHYKPSRKSLEKVYAYLDSLYSQHPGLFDRDSAWARGER